MQLRFDVAALVKTLPVMGYGMLGGVIVMAMLCGALYVLYRIGKRKEA